MSGGPSAAECRQMASNLITRGLLLPGLLLCGLWATKAAPARSLPSDTDNSLTWPPITQETRPWAYWWWLGSAVNRADLTRELERYRQAGMGGVHVIPIYGAKGSESQYVPYLSARWLDLLRHTMDEAQRLDLGVDMTLGTGWCFGGPTVPDMEAAARAKLTTYDVPADGRYTGSFDQKALQALVAFAEDGRQVDLTDRLGQDGSVTWTPPQGSWKVHALIQEPSGSRVKRAAPGGGGWMLNPIHGEAMRNYLSRFSIAFDAYADRMPRGFYHDSYEYSSDWSPDLLREFERRRGYALQGYLPHLFVDSEADMTRRVKADYRQTVAELISDNMRSTWITWAHQRGSLARYQAHGSPANLLDLYALADIPETEMFNQDRDPLVAKLASSAAHITGKKLVAAETGTWLAEHFTVTLDQLKRLADDLFIGGVNHVIYHGTCYSPDDAPWPGWLFYASTQMNPRNAFWRDVPTLNSYIARCQSVLQAGSSSGEILLYWPIHDTWHAPSGRVMPFSVHGAAWFKGEPLGKAALALWEKGFTFDYVSDDLLEPARAQAGGIALPGGVFRAVVVPECQRMPLRTLRRLLQLAREGVTVIFQQKLPTDVPGLANLEKRRAILRDLLMEIRWTEIDEDMLRTAKIGRGRIIVGELPAALGLAEIRRECLADYPGVRFIRRAAKNGHNYFVVNQGDAKLDSWVSLSTKASTVALMDPMNGRTGWTTVRKDSAGYPQIRLRLEPGASLLLRTFSSHPPVESTWQSFRAQGEPIEIGGTWQVAFIEGGPELPRAHSLQQLSSWTTNGDPASERFAGTARYTLCFDAPGAETEDWLLDLGEVCQSARIRLNQHDLGTSIMPPHRVEAPGLRPTGNVLEVEVTNLSANRIRDLDRRQVPWRIFHDINFVNINYKAFDASVWPLRQSGLIGPVRLQPGQLTVD